MARKTDETAKLGEKPAAEARAPIARPSVLRVVAARGPRRRAGLAFDRTPRELTEDDLDASAEARQATVDALLADPLLSVSPIVPEKPAE